MHVSTYPSETPRTSRITMSILDSGREALNDFALMRGGGDDMATTDSEGPSHIIFGTVVRAAPIERGGELILLDWEKKSIEGRVSMRPRDPTIGEDPDPRGNARGCRGIRWDGDQCYAATYHTVEVYDRDLTRTGALNGGLMVGLHELALTERGTIWVTSTAIDAVLEYDLETGNCLQSFWPREMSSVQEALDVEPLEIDKSADNRLAFLSPSPGDSESHLHINAVEPVGDRVYALSNDYGCILELTTEDVVLRDEGLEDAHNLLISEDGLVTVNDTFGRTVRFYDLDRGTKEGAIDLTRYTWVRQLMRWKTPAYWGKEVAKKLGLIDDSVARPLFVRGLVRFGDMLFIGVSPAAILQVNWKTGDLVDAYQYSDDVFVCVHGLDVVEMS